MSCERTKTQIHWYLYNELDETQRSEVEDHLESCQDCSAEAERERAFLATLRARPSLEPPAALLAECRQDLMRSVYHEERLSAQKAAPRVDPSRGWLDQWFTIRVGWKPALAGTLLMLGFAGGWWMRAPQRTARLLDPTAMSIANISGVRLDPAADQVLISYDELQRRTLQGRLHEPHIQKFLIYAATNYANPSVRLDTLDILKERAGERDMRATLLHLVANDRNAGVRLKALEALKAHAQDPEVRQALIGVLTSDDNPGMRVQAIDLLMQAQDRSLQVQDRSLVDVLQGVAAKEPNNYVRMRCRDALRDMNASVETF